MYVYKLGSESHAIPDDNVSQLGSSSIIVYVDVSELGSGNSTI